MYFLKKLSGVCLFFGSLMQGVESITCNSDESVSIEALESSGISWKELELTPSCALDSSLVNNLTDRTWDSSVKSGEWILQFTIEPCELCHKEEYMFNDLSHQMKEIYPNIQFGRVYMNENPELTVRLLVETLPVYYFINGNNYYIIPPSVLPVKEALAAYSKHQFLEFERVQGFFSLVGPLQPLYKLLGKALSFYSKFNSPYTPLLINSAMFVLSLLFIRRLNEKRRQKDQLRKAK
ncbi:ER stress response thioredoxin family membrane disulfide oxidoreductase [Schizosaccharomyces osmophilus]|uniref:ER stress response thioredoxin family membrane disulfide oxidoreductase n=1 Tax=Schizosaccharomyces osmophilus TaxID=2545709 RepID=A0AAF0AYN2_9SCHI|nr:ER stress response thioredoxin family membrane disulfide oxidoreductase [Schizosaccharomyces osmophilus]WBW75170.1 ER stress response thioredoxin family membrane disulfide oxidoreductase [Schizosaccharomyces osmophilus]